MRTLRTHRLLRVAALVALAALQALTPCRYVLDWQAEYPSMRCYRE